nr:MAG TPA: Pre-mRNA-splicing factor 8, U4/U6 small, assembly, pre-B complex, U1 [Caudoviricetes sp.]DAY63422.1 MAG TPA: Pre-mRNA-splicing factor 8, U4/U6 small, assembly, pre-B complex, U1 [Caudoviricetes sp.]
MFGYTSSYCRLFAIADSKYIPGYGRGAFSVCNRNLRILKAKGIILRNVIYELSDHLF